MSAETASLTEYKYEIWYKDKHTILFIEYLGIKRVAEWKRSFKIFGNNEKGE